MFRFHSLKIKGHRVLGNFDVCLKDDNNTADQSNIYSTVFIGRNGVGKSHLLRIIVEVFQYLEDVSCSRNLSYDFLLQYSVDGYEYKVANYEFYSRFRDILRPGGRMVCAQRNGVIVAKESVKLPGKIIASCMGIMDRFPTKSSLFYRYKGARYENSPSSTGTRAIVRKTTAGLLKSIDHKTGFINELKTLLRELGLKEELILEYQVKYKNLFVNRSMSVSLFKSLFEDWRMHFPNRKSPIRGADYYHVISGDDQLINTLVKFLKRLSAEGAYSRSYKLKYDVLDDISFTSEEREAILVLSKLGILSFPSLRVSREKEYDLEGGSTGEMNVICQLIGIMSEISDDSLVVIDEPENSCHPDWQMKYIDWLKNIFKRYCSCHFVIATHSHFILSNLEDDLSTVVSLEKNGISQLESKVVGNTFGWTSDEVLMYAMNLRNLQTKRFIEAEKLFNEAIDNSDTETAERAYSELLSMLHPDSSLREILRIQKIGIE